jgi:hypothetical protein
VVEIAMTTKRRPGGGAVIIGSLTELTERRLERVLRGALKKVSETPPTLVIEAAAEDPRVLVERVNSAVGSEALVAPLLTDDEGNRLFPTGRLVVRFDERPSDQTLLDLAERHGVEFAQRNKWAERQAEFEVPKTDERFLPDIAAALNEEKGVTNAWQEVQAAFRRV